MSPLTRLVRAVVGLAALGAFLAGALAVSQHLGLFLGRASFPLDLEWMEGGMLTHAQRLAEGKNIYVPPSLDFIPYLYTPLYPALLALLSKLVPLGYLLGRAVSIFAFLSALGLLFYAALRQALDAPVLRAATRWPPPKLRWVAIEPVLGMAAAGAVASSFGFTGSFYDLVRADSLLLLLEAGALTVALFGNGMRTAALAGVLIALGFFTKQTASVLGIAIGLGLLASQWRRGLVYGLTAAAVLAAGLLLLNLTSDGWFWRYVFELHQSHGFNARLAYVDTPLRLLRQYGLVYAALGLALLALALGRRLQRRDLIHLLAAVAGFAAACVGFGTQWAFDNAFIPAVYFPLYSAGVLGARLAGWALEEIRTWSILSAGLASCLFCAALVLQILPHAVPDRRYAPGPNDRAAAQRFLDKLRALQADGPLFIPFHPFYAVLAGSPGHVHRMGVLDVAAQLGRPAGLDQALAEGRFAHVILDWKSQPWEWPTLEARYHEIHQFTDGVDAVRSFSGAETSPRRLLVRTTAAPPVPAGGRRLFDFESGWQDWRAVGEGFGAQPAPALAGLFGRAAADSRRFGPTAEGTLHAPPLVVDRPRLRFRLVGPPDPDLRVMLLAGPETVHSATPDGRVRDVEWDVSALRGRTVSLVIEDRSPRAGLAVDEIALY